MIVERQMVTNQHDVVAGMTIGGSDPNRREFAIWIGSEKRVAQDMACPAGEKDSLRQSPLFHRVPLAAFCAQHVHPRDLDGLTLLDCRPIDTWKPWPHLMAPDA